MYSGHALYISVTIFCNSLPLKTYAAKTCESLGKNKKNSGRWILLMTFKSYDDIKKIINEKYKTFLKSPSKFILSIHEKYPGYGFVSQLLIPQSHNTKLREHASQENGEKVMQFFPTAVYNVTTWRHSRLHAHWGAGEVCILRSPGIAAFPISLLSMGGCGRILTARREKFTSVEGKHAPSI